MLKIRLKRLGRKQQPSYRIIVIDSRKKRDGRAIKELGFYNPLSKYMKLDLMQMQYCIRNGAQMSKTVKYILNKSTV